MDVTQAIEPLSIDIRLADFDRVPIVSGRLHAQCVQGFQE